jgi:hypothetical protein
MGLSVLGPHAHRAPPTCTLTQPALNYAAIRARAAEFGMFVTTLNELTAVTPGTGGLGSTGSPRLRLRHL